MVGVTGNPGQGNYAASKAGMIGMIKSLGAEFAKRGVTVNCIAPGFIATPMTDELNDKQREAILPKVPAGAARHAGRCRGGGGLSGLRRGRLRHRPDPSRQRRHGDDLSRLPGSAVRHEASVGCSQGLGSMVTEPERLGKTPLQELNPYIGGAELAGPLADRRLI